MSAKSGGAEDKKKSKLKEALIIAVEIAAVSAVILAVLLRVQSSLKESSRSGSGNSESLKEEQNEQKETKEQFSDTYELEIRTRGNAVIAYRYTKDSSAKKAVRAMRASVGKKAKTGKYTLHEKYTWHETSKNVWSKYSVRFAKDSWIQSALYTDKYSWTLNGASYKSVGTEKNDDTNIILSAGDAAWIFSHCKEGTKVRVVTGKKNEAPPVSFAAAVPLKKTCGWDPTDPEDGNPYKGVANGTVSAYKGTVTVEKGHEPDYYANLIAINRNGKDVTKKMSHTALDVSAAGASTVSYRYKKKGEKLKAVLRFQVVDTTVPVVTISGGEFEYEVPGDTEEDLNTDSVKKDIEKLVRAKVSATEGEIKVSALPKEQLVIGDNPVRVTATDAEGNIGSAETMVEIKTEEQTEAADQSSGGDKSGGKKSESKSKQKNSKNKRK